MKFYSLSSNKIRGLNAELTHKVAEIYNNEIFYFKTPVCYDTF